MGVKSSPRSKLIGSASITVVTVGLVAILGGYAGTMLDDVLLGYVLAGTLLVTPLSMAARLAKAPGAARRIGREGP